MPGFGMMGAMLRSPAEFILPEITPYLLESASQDRIGFGSLVPTRSLYLPGSGSYFAGSTVVAIVGSNNSQGMGKVAVSGGIEFTQVDKTTSPSGTLSFFALSPAPDPPYNVDFMIETGSADFESAYGYASFTTETDIANSTYTASLEFSPGATASIEATQSVTSSFVIGTYLDDINKYIGPATGSVIMNVVFDFAPRKAVAMSYQTGSEDTTLVTQYILGDPPSLILGAYSFIPSGTV